MEHVFGDRRGSGWLDDARWGWGGVLREPSGQGVLRVLLEGGKGVAMGWKR